VNYLILFCICPGVSFPFLCAAWPVEMKECLCFSPQLVTRRERVVIGVACWASLLSFLFILYVAAMVLQGAI